MVPVGFPCAKAWVWPKRQATASSHITRERINTRLLKEARAESNGGHAWRGRSNPCADVCSTCAPHLNDAELTQPRGPPMLQNGAIPAIGCTGRLGQPALHRVGTALPGRPDGRHQ